MKQSQCKDKCLVYIQVRQLQIWITIHVEMLTCENAISNYITHMT